ncbi:16S rRNA (cytidine(1402)-2'-O)-methyltransferase [Vagococcus penaei]|uniref:Ribosomal RNA small subunit methyltransferase I n=1 Tax=Vagococcus penaei TaxID=633807 RepID=A0A1Q2D7U6_9ENTE|nr:16S rRNA (cytidine(1402)-2'-O)-methyltransferase [Vagococcus penaei]AQP54333.1 16S rRNA (cytidine(1402)-2'-O)-methyltransferase [Vagococcus penaei]RSU05780.1 16S rRNA (cytidine(1402)-2'-O)-methyltransferase [Vagococcus penaei]
MHVQQSFKNNTQGMGQLFLVPTPIGNLEDMTFRAVRILSEVDVIASEDTRNTQKLLNHFELTTKQVSLHEHNVRERIPELIARLQEGESIAQVSDAGMPSISDPGHELVLAAIEAKIKVIALPGASAGITALIASGIAPQPFVFYGFLNRKANEQKKELTELNQQTATLIFYESPHRVLKTLKVMEPILGSDRAVTLCRELTKVYEEYIRGTISELITYLSEHSVKGECCLIVAGNTHPNTSETSEFDLSSLDIVTHVNLLIDSQQLTTKEAIKQVAKQRDLKKQDVYKQYHS